MQDEISLLYSQDPNSGPCSKPDESSPCLPILFKIHYYLPIDAYTFQAVFLLQVSPPEKKNLMCSACATCLAHLILLDLITWMIIMSSKIVKPLIMQFSQSSCYLLPLRTKYVPQHMLLNTLSLCSSLSVSDHVSGPHKTTGKIYIFEYVYIPLENQGLTCHWNGTNNKNITH